MADGSATLNLGELWSGDSMCEILRNSGVKWGLAEDAATSDLSTGEKDGLGKKSGDLDRGCLEGEL